MSLVSALIYVRNFVCAGQAVETVEADAPKNTPHTEAEDDEVLEVFDETGQVVSRVDLAAEASQKPAAAQPSTAKQPPKATGNEEPLPGFGLTADDFVEEEAPAPKKAAATDDFGVAYTREVLPGEGGPSSGTALPQGAQQNEKDAFDEEDISSSFASASLAAQSPKKKVTTVVGSMAGPDDDSDSSDDDDFAFDAPALEAHSDTPTDSNSAGSEFMQRLAAARQAEATEAAALAEAESRKQLAAEAAAATAAGGAATKDTAADTSTPAPGSSASAAADFTVQHSATRTVTGSLPVVASADTSSVDEGSAMVGSASSAMQKVQQQLQKADDAKRQQEQAEREERVLAKGAELKQQDGGADAIIEEDDEEEEEDEDEDEEGSTVVAVPQGAPAAAASGQDSGASQVSTHDSAKATGEPASPTKGTDSLHTTQAGAQSSNDGGGVGGDEGGVSEAAQLALAAAQFEAGTAAVTSKTAAAATGDRSSYAPIKHAAAAEHLMGDSQAGRFRDSVVVKPAESRGLWTALTRTALSAGLKPERAAVFGVAKVQYDEGDEVHQRLMRSLYKALTGSELVGLTWTAVGFQNDNFVTDLRGVGMLGPLQLLMFAQRHHDFVLSRLLKAEGSPQWYPFAVQSLNMTLYALQALRAEKLNALANKADSVLEVLHQFYCALFVEFGEMFAASGAEGAYAGMLGQKAAEACSKDPAAAIAKYKRIVAEPGSAASGVGRGSLPAAAGGGSAAPRASTSSRGREKSAAPKEDIAFSEI